MCLSPRGKPGIIARSSAEVSKELRPGTRGLSSHPSAGVPGGKAAERWIFQPRDTTTRCERRPLNSKQLTKPSMPIFGSQQIELLQQQVTRLQSQLNSSTQALKRTTAELETVKKSSDAQRIELEQAQRERDDALKSLEEFSASLQRSLGSDLMLQVGSALTWVEPSAVWHISVVEHDDRHPGKGPSLLLLNDVFSGQGQQAELLAVVKQIQEAKRKTG